MQRIFKLSKRPLPKSEVGREEVGIMERIFKPSKRRPPQKRIFELTELFSAERDYLNSLDGFLSKEIT